MTLTPQKIGALAIVFVVMVGIFVVLGLWVNKKPSKGVAPLALTGIAQNAQAGAIIQVDGEVFYLEGVNSWPTNLEGKRVTVSGKLVEKKYIPDPGTDPNLPSAGAAGNQHVFENPTYKIAE